MATHAKKVTLEEAVRMSKCINNISFRWIIHKNILKEDPPRENYTFSNTEVFWCYTHEKFVLSANFPYKSSCVVCSVDYHFTSLEALRKACPELFKTKGTFKVIH